MTLYMQDHCQTNIADNITVYTMRAIVISQVMRDMWRFFVWNRNLSRLLDVDTSPMLIRILLEKDVLWQASVGE